MPALETPRCGTLEVPPLIYGQAQLVAAHARPLHEHADWLIAHQWYEEAIRVLVVRLALVRLVYGNAHVRVAEARLTLASAYLELRELPVQAFDHAKQAQRVLKRAREGAEPGPADGDDVHAAALRRRVTMNTYYVMGVALTKMQKTAEADKALERAGREW